MLDGYPAPGGASPRPNGMRGWRATSLAGLSVTVMEDPERWPVPAETRARAFAASTVSEMALLNGEIVTAADQTCPSCPRT